MNKDIKEIPISMEEQNIYDFTGKNNQKNYNRFLYNIGLVLKNKQNGLVIKDDRNLWFGSLSELKVNETFDSVIGKIRSIKSFKIQMSELDKKLKESWNELIYMSTKQEDYQKLLKSIAEKDLENCKKIIKKLCRIGEKFKYNGKEYEISQSGILAGIYLNSNIEISNIMNYLTKSTEFLQSDIFKEDMSKFEKYNMEILFGKFAADLTPIKNGNYKSDFKNNPNRIAEKECEKRSSGKITIKNYKNNYFSLNIPDYIDENGKRKSIDDTSRNREYPIKDISQQGKIVCDGAVLKCSGSTGKTSVLKILPTRHLLANDKPIGLLSDSKPKINIVSFGMCKLKSNPSVAANKNNPVVCLPVEITTWKNGVSYLSSKEQVICDKSTCKCSFGGDISIDPSQVGQSFLGHGINGGVNANGGNSNGTTGEKIGVDKNDKSIKLTVKEDTSVQGRSRNEKGLYLLEVEGETPAKIIQRHLKTIGFDLNHGNCKECDAYGKNASANNYKCTKGYKCIDGDMGVKSASALIIFQSKCNPGNPYAQKTGEPNIITGQADNVTIKSLGKYAEIKSKEGKEKRGIVKLSREDLIKDWKPVKYESIANGELPKGLEVSIPGKALNLPATSVAWAMMIQGIIEYNKTASVKLSLLKLQVVSWDCGFRTYERQLYYFIKKNCNRRKASRPKFKNEQIVIGENKATKKPIYQDTIEYIKLNKNYCLQNYKTLAKSTLSGVGQSNHGIGRAFDFVCGSEGHNYLASDPDGTNELIWLGDNAGKYGFSGYVGDFKDDKYKDNIISAYNKKMGFKHTETWHWEYLVDNKIYTYNNKNYTRTDCFNKEKREKLVK